MNKLLLVLVASFLSISSFSQEIEVAGLYSLSSSAAFQNSFGIRSGFNEFVNPKTRLGLSLEYRYNCFPFEDKYNADDATKYVDEVRPNNQQLGLKLTCSFVILNKSGSLLFIGPEIGILYMIFNEKIDRTTTTLYGDVYKQDNLTDHYVKPTTSIGFLFEYELRNIIAHKISAYVSINPEVTGLESRGMMGARNMTGGGWLNASIGIKYLFTKKSL
jgi:hypothetical protein